MALETLLLTLGMLVLASIPVFTQSLNRYYGPLFLFGTGALFSLCAFELLPEVFHFGGLDALWLVFAAWMIYSLVHVLHAHHHLDQSKAREANQHSPYPFFIAITIHCFSSGLFFGVSNLLSAPISQSIFMALVAHKAYESIAVSSLLVSFRRSKLWTFTLIGGYVLSFSVGFALARFFNGNMTHIFIMLISGVAVGTLLGCLCLDFIWPSYQTVKKSWREVVWLLLGIFLTLVF